MRFAFYGRISTADYQDQASSRRWQRDCAADLVTGHGVIVAEFFDVGVSRRRGWSERPRSAALLRAAAEPDREFDAVVVGEYERAFCGGQLAELLPALAARGVQVWLPETGGSVNLGDPAHAALIMLLGHQSRREVLRARFRTIAAMQVQAREQGRHLGGRPPYGYRLVDAGPHPNAAHARWGRRLQRLDPDLVTAPHVRRIFTRRLAGHSTASIARELNADGVPCPSGYDRERNQHRSGEAWTLRTVAAILGNPRYTGRQVWNRQRSDHEPSGLGSGPRRGRGKQRWNPQAEWVVSRRSSHPALISEQEFVAAQAVRATHTPADGSTRTYLLTGLVHCGTCNRRMVGHWVHGRPGYRCRHGYTSASPHRQDRPSPVYVREDRLLASVVAQLNGADAFVYPGDVVGRLRASGVQIIWTGRHCTLRRPTGDPAEVHLRPTPTPQDDDPTQTLSGRRGV